MDGFKVTSWNIEWSDKLLDVLEGPDGREKVRARIRLDAIKAEIALIAPDILLIGEGPRGEDRAQDFFDRVAPGYALVTRGDATGKSYRTQGRQWVWFLLKAGIPARGTLLHLDRWTALVEQASLGAHKETWPVALPRFERTQGGLRFEAEVAHRHYRHPQVLLAEIDGFRFEVIGAHLKSKFVNLATPPGVGTPGFFKNNPEFVAEIVEARVKLTSEASNMRYYIDERLKAERNAPIIVAGDFNDGPGKEMVEEQFLLHDLIGNLQGDVFFARGFLNHALFDFDEAQRWSVQFTDVLDRRRPREILLDHILFTQGFVGPDGPDALPFRAAGRGGLVEHEAHHAVNAGVPRGAETSDHRPVSMTFHRRASGPTT